MPRHNTRKNKRSCRSHGGTRKQRGGFLLRRIGAFAKKMKPLGNTVTEQMKKAHEKTMGHVDSLLTHMKNAGNNKHVISAKKKLEKVKDHGIRLREEFQKTQVGQNVTRKMRVLQKNMSDGISQAHANLRMRTARATARLSFEAAKRGFDKHSRELEDFAVKQAMEAKRLQPISTGGRKKRGHKKRHATKKHGHKKRHATKKRGHKKRKQRGGKCGCEML